MSKEQQKAKLLDDLFDWLKPCFNEPYDEGTDEHMRDMIQDAKQEYDVITAQKPLTADPYADEVFSGRLCRFLAHYFFGDTTELRLSECPKIDLINTEKGFGRKSREEYITIMKQYGFNDKI